MNYYVYYKVPPGRVDEVRDGVARVLVAVEQRCGVRGRWMRRRDDAATYMEVYEGVTDEAAFEAVLAAEGARLGLERRIERFQCA